MCKYQNNNNDIKRNKMNDVEANEVTVEKDLHVLMNT